MSFGLEELETASQIYFQLVKKRVLEAEDPFFQKYYESTSVQEVVQQLALQSGTDLLQTHQRIHLIVKADSDVFATNFTRLKDKYSHIENKSQWHVITIIMMVFLANIETNYTFSRTDHPGITYYALEQMVTQTLRNWKEKCEEDVEFAKNSRLAIQESETMWSTLDIEILQRKKENMIRGNHKSRLGLIQIAMGVLKEENLVYIADRTSTPKAIPTIWLFERLEGLYRDQTRFQELKRLITERGNINA
ncbi:hypothetical protein CEW92_14135 [Bacillaceae bacterium SAS-127]|nr:hypothetical protein CEW92_14135 [Bacillaceae bacterium SAS-127]